MDLILSSTLQAIQFLITGCEKAKRNQREATELKERLSRWHNRLQTMSPTFTVSHDLGSAMKAVIDRATTLVNTCQSTGRIVAVFKAGSFEKEFVTVQTDIDRITAELQVRLGLHIDN